MDLGFYKYVPQRAQTDDLLSGFRLGPRTLVGLIQQPHQVMSMRRRRNSQSVQDCQGPLAPRKVAHPPARPEACPVVGDLQEDTKMPPPSVAPA